MNRGFGPVLLLIAVAALGLRMPQLERRPMHNDEAVNAVRFRHLWAGAGYRYDPHEFHGPTLPYFSVIPAALSGQSAETLTEKPLRWVPVLFGVGLILLLPLFANGLGRAEVLWAGALTAISPAMVFYSRYYIHEMLLVFFTGLLLAAGWRYAQSGRLGWCVLAGAALGLMHATKETFVFAVAAAAAAAIGATVWSRKTAHGQDEPWPTIRPAAVGIALLAALVISTAFFTSFFTNPSGPIDSLRTYAPWFERARGNSPHEHPWYFYFRRLLFFHYKNGPYWSEWLIFLLGTIGLAAAVRGRDFGGANPAWVRTIALYTVILTILYTIIPYKTPWCLLGFWHGMILMSGVGVMVLFRRCRRSGPRAILMAALVAGLAHLSWQAWRASYPMSASQFNPYVYAHTSPDLLDLVGKVEALSQFSPNGYETLVKVMATHNDYWPLPWYLRKFRNVGWWGEIPEDPLAPIMIVSSSFQAAFDERPEKTHLMAGYFQLRPQVFFELYVELNLWRRYVESLPRQRED